MIQYNIIYSFSTRPAWNEAWRSPAAASLELCAIAVVLALAVAFAAAAAAAVAAVAAVAGAVALCIVLCSHFSRTGFTIISTTYISNID